MKYILISTLLCIIAFNTTAQQVNDYEINVEFFPKKAQMWGFSVSPDAFMRGNSLVRLAETTSDSICFYLHGELKIDSIISNGERLNYQSEKVLYQLSYNKLAVKTILASSQLGSDKSLKIYYSGFMNPSKAGSLSNYMHINKNSGVFLRSQGYSLWFPVFQHPNQDEYEANFKTVSVNLPKNFKCVVNGQLLSEKIENDRYNCVWKPGFTNVSYLQITAREFEIATKDNVSVYYLNNKEIANKIIDYTIQLRKLYEEKFQKVNNSSALHLIEMPKYGDIWSLSVIGIRSKTFNRFDKSIYTKSTIAHELVHPYVRIPVANSNPFSALVIEGFPSFFDKYALHKTLDKTSFNLKEEMQEIEKEYLKNRKTGKNWRGDQLPIEKPILQITHSEIGQYKDEFVLSDRVSLFLYHLWSKMGDNKYDKFLKELFQFTSINYTSFEQLILKYLPDYKENLNIWLNTTDYPKQIQLEDNNLNS
ncbi:MAG: hypothetical protein ACEPOZ_02385 [Marinifilaceae bacterium]